MLLRPYGIVIEGKLELGLELEVEDGVIRDVLPHTGIPDDFVVSAAFVNAHSHLEYRGLQGRVPFQGGYWDWIRDLTQLKQEQNIEDIAQDCLQGAVENRATGVAVIGEHSDRPYSGAAMAEAGLRGVIYQEIITFFERDSRVEKLSRVGNQAEVNGNAFSGPVLRAPHAYYTADRQTLAEVGASGEPFSIHVAETELESLFTRSGISEIAEFYRRFGVPFEPTGRSVVDSLDQLGLVRPGAQFVHCCALEGGEAELLGERGVSVAHCPRSNRALGCPDAPVRELLNAGVHVGLGLDSAASSGPIDMFAEMREALAAGSRRGEPLMPQEVWSMATTMGARSVPGFDFPKWDASLGSSAPLIKIHLRAVQTVEDLIHRGLPELVEWV